jgi:hypothetical protein
MHVSIIHALNKLNSHVMLNTESVILACPESLFAIPDPEASGEGFPTSGNDNTKGYVNLFSAFVLDN